MAAVDVAVGVQRSPRRVGASRQVAGAAGLVFLILIAFQNVLRAASGPATNASPEQVLSFFATHAWTVHLFAITYVIGFLPLFVFAAGIAEIAGTEARSRIWARVGLASVAVVAVLFGLVNAVQVVLVAAQSTLRGDPALVQALWSAHNAVFTLNLVAVGGALAGLGLAATSVRLVPAWMAPSAVGGALLLIVAALPTVAEVHGSPILALGLLGFLIWLLFLCVAGIRMLRGD